MEKMINLRDLLMHEVLDLYSAEEQIIKALPSMIEKANNNSLKKALQDHLQVTEKQKDRLDQVKKLLGEEEQGEEKKGFFSRLFGGGSHKCKGTEGLIEEGEKMMGENMTSEVRDAAIIASAQKIEHYEICGYGTARAYARELNLGEVAELLEETLNEEYAADDLLTDLAVGKLNEEAEKAKGNTRSNGRTANKASGGDSGNSVGKGKSSGGGRNAGKGKPAGVKSSSRSTAKSSKGNSSKGAYSRTAAPKRTASKSSSGGRKAGKSGGGAGTRGGKQNAPASRGKSSGGRGKGKRGGR